MCDAVHVRVGHDHDLVIPELGDVELLGPDAGAEGGDEHLDLVGGEHLVEPRLLHVQDLALERQDGLVLPVPALLGRAAGGIALDDEELRQGRVLFLAVRELARERRGVEHALPARELPRLPRRLAGPGRIHSLFRDLARDKRVLLEIGAEGFVHHGLDDALDLAVAELRLGLALELRVLQAARSRPPSGPRARPRPRAPRSRSSRRPLETA